MAAGELEVTVRDDGDTATIDLAGDVDSAAESALEEGYRQALAGGSKTIVLDFSGAAYINSSGIALIVSLLGQARGHGIEVQARGLSDHYREIFEITRLADFLAINPDEDSAVRGAEGTTDA